MVRMQFIDPEGQHGRVSATSGTRAVDCDAAVVPVSLPSGVDAMVYVSLCCESGAKFLRRPQTNTFALEKFENFNEILRRFFGKS